MVVVGASGVVVDVDEEVVACSRGRNVITTGGFGVGGVVSGTAVVGELLDELDDELLEELDEEELLEELLDEDDSGGPSTQTHTMT